MFSFWALLALVFALWWIWSTSGSDMHKGSGSNLGTSALPRFPRPCFQFGSPGRMDEDRFKNQAFRRLVEHPSPGRPGDHFKRVSTVHEIGRIDPVHILCIGEGRRRHFISDEILDIPGFKVITERDYKKLGSTFHGSPVLVLIHDSFPSTELEDACRLVRREWPDARILLIHDGDVLEDTLFDDRVRTDVTGKDLIARILFLVQTVDLWRWRDVQGRSK